MKKKISDIIYRIHKKQLNKAGIDNIAFEKKCEELEYNVNCINNYLKTLYPSRNIINNDQCTKDPILSVCISTYNRSGYLEKSLETAAIYIEKHKK